MFTATGFGPSPGGSSSTAPKAIIEVISFNGDGTADTPKVTLSVNGTVINESPRSSGTYAIDTSTANGVCTGTLDFNGGPSGDSEISLILTDKGNTSGGRRLPADGATSEDPRSVWGSSLERATRRLGFDSRLDVIELT